MGWKCKTERGQQTHQYLKLFPTVNIFTWLTQICSPVSSSNIPARLPLCAVTPSKKRFATNQTNKQEERMKCSQTVRPLESIIMFVYLWYRAKKGPGWGPQLGQGPSVWSCPGVIRVLQIHLKKILIYIHTSTPKLITVIRVDVISYFCSSMRQLKVLLRVTFTSR